MARPLSIMRHGMAVKSRLGPCSAKRTLMHPNNQGNRPLHYAATYDQYWAASELLESGAAIIILKKCKHGLRETLLMPGTEVV